MSRPILLALVTLAACSSAAERPAGPTEPATRTDLLIRNATSQPVAYVAAAEGVLALLALPPTLQRADYQDHLVPVGATVPVSDIVGGYQPRAGVDFHLYVVDPHSGAAYRAGSFLASATELARTGGVAVVTPGRL